MDKNERRRGKVQRIDTGKVRMWERKILQCCEANAGEKCVSFQNMCLYFVRLSVLFNHEPILTTSGLMVPYNPATSLF